MSAIQFRQRITGYLAATVHLDSGFRALVRDLILEAHYRDVATDEEVDLDVVVKHRRLAMQRILLRDIALFAALVLVGWVVSANIGYYGDPSLAIGAIVVGLLASFSIILIERYTAERRAFDAQLAGVPPAAESELSPTDDNLIVYSGFLPFVGSGILVGSWSFTLNVDRAASNMVGTSATLKEFDVQALYQAIDDHLRELNLETFKTFDRLYAFGREIGEDDKFVPNKIGRPVGQVQSDIVNRYIDQPEQYVRHYKIYRVVHWGGDVAYTICFRCWKGEKNIFVEANSFVMPPLQNIFYRVDEIRGLHPLVRFLKHIGVSALFAPILPFVAAISIFRRMTRPIFILIERWLIRSHIRRGRKFNYGAQKSLREAIIDDDYHVFFQKLDQQMYTKILEKELIDVLIDFMSEMGVDVSDLRERSSTVLNYGVLMAGGSLRTQNLAVSSTQDSRSGGPKKFKAPKRNVRAN